MRNTVGDDVTRCLGRGATRAPHQTSPPAGNRHRYDSYLGRASVLCWLLALFAVAAGGWQVAEKIERMEYENTCSYWWTARGVPGYVSPEDQALGRDRYMQVCMARQREEEKRYLASPDPENHICKWQDGAGCPPNPDLRIPWLIFIEFVGLGGFLVWKRKRRPPSDIAGWPVAMVTAIVPFVVYVLVSFN